ncbi:MAG: DUF4317 domain-containing protein [Clostridium sp.]|nr:DUF4317 domain-containing protein [Clostridium sp.]
MRKKDILELRKRLKKNDCTFTRMCGCYVDANKNIVLNINETFLNLEEEEFFKYLEIAKKAISGTIGNNLLKLDFPVDGEHIGGRQNLLMELKKSRLKDENILNEFYDSIIDNLEYTGNYLILVFHDAYDVLTKTSDNLKLDESEEVYEYILCAICPVELSKAGLGYFEDDNRIGARVRDWVVEAPALGFTFPAFIDRSSDIYSVMYYTKNPKDSHPEFMEAGLGCDSKQTATEQKETFTNIIKGAIDADEEKTEHIFMEIQESLNNFVEEKEACKDDNDEEPITLNNTNIQDILIENGISEEVTSKIEKSYTKEFGDTPPVVEHLIDKKVLAANEQRKKEQRLEQKVQVLQQRLDETKQEASEYLEQIENANQVIANMETENTSEAYEAQDEVATDDTTDTNVANYDVVVKVKPEKVAQIKSQIIDGKKCIIIPMDEDEQANVNGTDTVL